MKAVILAGGFGTRISEETHLKPKPMVEIGGKPILWHILKIYSQHGINDFIICCGYKGYLIKEYFANYFLHNSDITIDVANGTRIVHEKKSEPWKVTLVDTGENTMTGGRLLKIKEYVREEAFCMTYGDGVSNVNITDSIKFHKEKCSKVTLTAVQPPGRFGAIDYHRGKVVSFEEKPVGDGTWINGGFFVIEPDELDKIENENAIWEQDCMPSIAKQGGLHAYKHSGYWQPMDTMRDKKILEELWATGKAPWKTWK